MKVSAYDLKLEAAEGPDYMTLTPPTEEQARLVLAQSGLNLSPSKVDDLFTLPGDQQAALLEEVKLEAQARPEDYGADALEIIAVALKIIAGAGSLEGAVTLVTSVPALVAAVQKL